jgi:hypothetical protein
MPGAGDVRARPADPVIVGRDVWAGQGSAVSARVILPYGQPAGLHGLADGRCVRFAEGALVESLPARPQDVVERQRVRANDGGLQMMCKHEFGPIQLGPRQSNLVRRLLTSGGDSGQVRIVRLRTRYLRPLEAGHFRGRLLFTRLLLRSISYSDSQITRQNRLLRESGQPRWPSRINGTRALEPE